MKTALILYELQQLASLDSLLSQGDDQALVSLGADIDYALDARGLTYISGKTLLNRREPAAYMRAEEIVRDICEAEPLSFLEYKGISLLRPVRFSLHLYLINLLFYIERIAHLLDAHPDIRRLRVPSPRTPFSATSAFLAEHGVFVVVEAVRRVAESRGVEFEVVQAAPLPARIGGKASKALFTLKRTLFGAMLSLLNAVLSLRPRKALRIVATDYWRNISPLMRELPEAELVLLDRTEVLKAGWRAAWRHNIRPMHLDHFLSRRDKQAALAFARECRERYESMRANAWQGKDLTFCGANLETLLERVMTRLIERALPRVATDIAGAYALCGALRPDAVLVRASVSEQLHFSILPLAAKEMGIGAYEVQHGGEYLGPGSPTKDHAAHYFATYGPLVCEELRALGYAPERLLAVGSPRFDAYIEDAKKARPRDDSVLTILSNTPNANVGERFGTYSVEEYFATVGKAAKDIPNTRLRITSRNTDAFGQEARSRAFKGIAYEYEGTKPLPKLFIEADIFVCSHSTIVYEALLYRLPVIVASIAPVEAMMSDFHFGTFKDAGALMIVHTQEDLEAALKSLAVSKEKRDALGRVGFEFMQKNFTFDGQASKRLAQILRTQAKVGGAS